MNKELTKYTKQQLTKNKSKYIEFFKDWVDLTEENIEKSINNIIDKIDYKQLLKEWEQNKKELLNGRMSIKKTLILSEDDYVLLNFREELYKKFIKKTKNIRLFNRIYQNYFSKFTDNELLANKNKQGQKISKGLKQEDISQKDLRMFQDIYSEVIQENTIPNKKKKIILEASIKPIDFLTMSVNPNEQWTTCQNSFLGEKGIGVFSYMTDNSSIIFQAYYEEEENKLIKNKLWRSLGFLSVDKNVLTLSTEYPVSNIIFREESLKLLNTKAKIQYLPLNFIEEEKNCYNTLNFNFEYGDLVNLVPFVDYAAGNLTNQGIPTSFLNGKINSNFKTEICTNNNFLLPIEEDIDWLEDICFCPTFGILTSELIINNSIS